MTTGSEEVIQLQSRPAGRHRLSDFYRSLHRPVDIAPIVFFRIFFGAMMAYHISSMVRDQWIHFFYIQPDFHFTYPGFSWVRPWPGDGMYVHFAVLVLAAVGIMLGFCYRLSALLFFLGYTHLFLLEKALYQNHCYLICLISGIMAAIPAHRAFSIDQLVRKRPSVNTVPAWMLRLLQLQLAIPYLYGGLAKLNADWLQAQPMKLWLERRNEVPVLGEWLSSEWMPWAFAYGGLAFDLLVIPALLWKRTRIIAYCAALGFHLMNAVLWDIGVFPWFMIGATLLFFPPHWFRKYLPLSNHRLNLPPAPAPAMLSSGQLRTSVALSVYVAWQLLFPLRHYAIPGDASWTEEGHHFAWHMMLREKDVGIRFYVHDPATNESGLLRVEEFLSIRQLSRMGKDPDMVLEFVHHVRDHYREHADTELEIYVLNISSLNGRKPQLLTDPKLNYAAVERCWLTQPWIVDLQEALRTKAWDVPLTEWENRLDLDIPDRMKLGQHHQKPRLATRNL